MKELFESSYLSAMGEENERLRKEIERLNNEKESFKKLYKIELEVSSNLDNIINEVREYLKEDINGNYFKRYDDEVYKMCEELLEILDKGE